MSKLGLSIKISSSTHTELKVFQCCFVIFLKYPQCLDLNLKPSICRIHDGHA